MYDPVSPDDGKRILVDRLWPRGMKKEAARIDEWLKDIAPSDALRKWYAHDPGKWAEFRDRYRRELDKKIQPLEHLREEAQQGKVTLLFAAKDTEHNNAVVLKNILEA